MNTKTLPLKELSIAQIYNGDKATYEVPIYQRNYAWGKDEIFALIQDVYDASISGKKTYFIGTLVSFHKGDQIYEVIDGQQRLTTINIALKALDVPVQNKLTYRARKKSDDTIKSIPNFQIDEKDYGIIKGFEFAKNAINEIVPDDDENRQDFKNFFQDNVHLIHYQVPKDIDLNHYFEIMNSRGEQLEKHEIIKARLIETLNDTDKEKFNHLWESCSDMNVYIQKKYRKTNIFGSNPCDFNVDDFDALPKVDKESNKKFTINKLIYSPIADNQTEELDKPDTFQLIMDFSNFLLIVLKLTRMEESDFTPATFILDDKELINEFDKVELDEEFTKQFGYNLLKGKFLLDNYLVHHSDEQDTIESNPWKLQYWYQDGENEYLKNLSSQNEYQNKLVQLLSMFEVSFTAKQRKNYLFYCMLYLFNNGYKDISSYYQFVSDLADKYFKDVYLVKDNLSTINIPTPGSFDKVILPKKSLDTTIINTIPNFEEIYGDGEKEASKGISLFIFNYLDYKLWEQYADKLRGKKTTDQDPGRKDFFSRLGCSDFELEVFNQFYFSRTRSSLEHFYPTANATENDDVPNEIQINCLGNYAMIGSEANSSGSNWSPKAKLHHYLDSSGKIKQVSVASIKFMIMMQKCGDNLDKGQEWSFKDIKEHQNKMLEILLPTASNQQ